MKRTVYLLLSLLGITVLIACSSDVEEPDGIGGGGRGGSTIGFLTLSITDVPVDNAEEVWVQIDGITLQHEAEPTPTTIPVFPPKRINLLTLQGQNNVVLVEKESVLAGNYNWIRLDITASEDGVLDSYIKLKSGGMHELALDIPGGSETGLKINDQPRIVANSVTELTFDFDLRKSIILTGSGEYKLKPVLKLVTDALTTSIKGTVELSVLDNSKSNCTDDDPATHNFVYLYNGFNVTPGENGGGNPPDYDAPVELNPLTGDYEYEFGFIPFGEYTAAFTCQEDTELNDDIEFSKAKNVQLSNTNPKILPGNTFR